MTAPLCRECGKPVTEGSWTAKFSKSRRPDEVCMKCRNKRGRENAKKTMAARRREGV